MQGMMQDLAFAIPGVDEAMGFAEIMKCVSPPFFPSFHPSLPLLLPLARFFLRPNGKLTGLNGGWVWSGT